MPMDKSQREGMNSSRIGLRVSFAVVVSVFALNWAAPGQDRPPTIRRHEVEVDNPMYPPDLAQAEAAMDKSDYVTAEPLLEKVVKRNAANYRAWFDLGFVQTAIGKPADAIAAYRRAVAAKPDVFESNLNLGLMLAQAGQPEAEQFLRAAIRLKPTAQVDEGHARAWMGLARVLETSRPEDAIEAYRQAAALRPRNAEPHLYAGVLLEKENHFADAEEEYKKALAMDSTSSDAVTALANLYMRGRQLEKAGDMLRKLVVAHPQDSVAHLQLGRVLAASGKNEEAAAELESALKIAPNDPAAAREVAELYMKAGKYSKAETAYRALLVNNSRDADLHERLGQACIKLGKFGDAQKEFLAVVQLKPDLGDAYGELADAASENKDDLLTIRALDTRAKFLPEIPMTYFVRAIAYDHLRDYKDAAVNYHKFLEVDAGKYPDHEWQARHRLITIEPKK
jgi:tetratricopeptide (TPR) repeat protein